MIDCDVIEHYLSRVVIDAKTGCWTLGDSTRQAGRVRINGKNLNANRIFYQFLVDKELDDAFPLYRLCGNKLCVNPEHLTTIHKETLLFGNYKVRSKCRFSDDFIKRLTSRIIKDADSNCWCYDGSLTHNGYGNLKFRGKFVASHRAIYEIFVDDISDNLYVLHKCDNPKCCNPSHLFLGNQHDNMQDMVCKNRSANMVGENNGRSLLTEEQVKYILNSTEKYRILAGKFNVSLGTIKAVKRRQNWRHISE